MPVDLSLEAFVEDRLAVCRLHSWSKRDTTAAANLGQSLKPDTLLHDILSETKLSQKVLNIAQVVVELKCRFDKLQTR